MSPDTPYTAPTPGADAFNCPFCNAFSQQDWGAPLVVAVERDYGSSDRFRIARCRRCTRFSIWMEGSMVYPAVLTAPEPNPDLSADVRRDYQEARAIYAQSPRGTAALLRLAIQKIAEVSASRART